MVIGGGVGFLGQSLVHALYKNGCSVSILSIEPPHEFNPEIPYFQGDLKKIEDIIKACQGIDTVFHPASIVLPSGFMSSKLRKHIFEVNVLGTKNVINACIECGVSRLVYTSSNNVVFDRDIANGDENLPYATKFIDVYTRTKVISEKEVLAANGRSGLLTCALRPGGIYGPGDKIIFPRMVESLKKGRLKFTIGDGKALADSVYIDNVVDAHLLAASKLVKNSDVAGQAYFISDGEPSNYFVFMRPLIEGMGYKFPSFAIPYSLAYATAYVAELLHWLLRTPNPFLTRMEVNKVSLSNYFIIDKAKRDLGYSPQVTQKAGIAKCLTYCLKLHDEMEVVYCPHPLWWVSVFVGMVLLGLFAFNSDAYAFFAQHITSKLSKTFLQGLFLISVILHFGEAFYAFYLARRAGLKSTAKGWCIQTFLLGYPSLRLLLKHIKKSIS